MKLGMIITQTDAETVFNALRLALYSLQQGDNVRLFVSGKGVEIDQINDPKFDVKGQAQKVLEAGGKSRPAAPASNYAMPRDRKSARFPP